MPTAFTTPLEQLAHWLGHGRARGPSSVVVRTVGRLVRFHLAMPVDAPTCAGGVPPLTKRQLAALRGRADRPLEGTIHRSS